MRKGILALEELNTETDADTPVEEVAAFVDAPENDIADADAAAVDLNTEIERTEAAADTAETLETVAERAEATLPEGGMDEKAVDTLDVAVEQLLNQVGFSKRKSKVFPSLENFAAPGDARLKNTKLAIESIKERAKEIWQAIVSAIKRAVAYVKQFFTSLLNATKGLEERADDLFKKAEGIKGSQSGKIKSSALLTVDGSALDGAGVLSAYQKYVNTPVSKADRLADAVKALDDIQALANLGDGQRAAEKAYDDLYALLTLENFGQAKPHLQDGKVSQELKLGLGQKSLFLVLNAESEKDSGAVAKLLRLGTSRCYVGDASDAKKVEAAEVTPATSEGVKALTKLVKDHMKRYESMKADVQKLDSASNALLSKLDKLTKEQGEYVGDALKAASGAVRGANNVLVSGTASLKSFDVKIAKAALDFAGASLNAYGKEEKKAA